MSLEDAVWKAIQASPRLRSFEARLEAAKGVESQAGLWPNPQFVFEAENVAGAGRFSGTDLAEFTYSISQTIEIAGKRSARKNAARAAREAANAALMAERLNLIRDVHVTYSEVLAEAEALKLAIEQEGLAKEVLDSVSELVEAAREPEIQQSKAEVAYANSVISREQEERQFKIAKEKLTRLWGETRLGASLDHSHFFELEAPETLEYYLERLPQNPELRRFSYLRDEKTSILDLEKARAAPDPSLNVGIRDLRESGDQAFVFGLSMPIPLLNFNQGNVRRARAEMRRAESDRRQAELVLEQRLVERWQNWQIAYNEAERLKELVLPSAEKAFSLALDGYHRGRFPYLEVLDAQRTLFDANARFFDALKRYHSSRADVERLTTTTVDQKKLETR